MLLVFVQMLLLFCCCWLLVLLYCFCPPVTYESVCLYVFHYTLCQFIVVKYVYKHVSKQIVHAHTLTQPTIQSPCAVLFRFDWFFVSLHFVTIHSILLLDCLFLFYANTVHSTRFDHFRLDNLFTLYQFNLIRALILSRLRIHHTTMWICVYVLRFNDTERQARRTIEVKRKKGENKKKHSCIHATLSSCVRCVMHACIFLFFIIMMMWVELNTRDLYHSFASMRIEQIGRMTETVPKEKERNNRRYHQNSCFECW